MAKTLCQIQVDPATKLTFDLGKVGLIIQATEDAPYQIRVYDSGLAGQLYNHWKVFGTISGQCVEIDDADGANNLVGRPLPVATHPTAKLILWPTSAQIKRK